VERVSARFAHHVIAANDLWYDKLTTRAVPRERCTTFLNYIDPEIFTRRERTRQDDRFIAVYPGSLNWHQGLDIAIRAFVDVRREVPNAELHIYGSGGERPRLEELIRSLDLSATVKFQSTIPLREIPQIMANADVGVVAKRNDLFGGEAYSTKIAEFMSQGLPVVAPRTRIDSHYFDDTLVHFFTPEDHHDMAAKIVALSRDKSRREELARNGLEYVRHNNWTHHEGRYLALVEGLAGIKRPVASSPTAVEL
jgi:glycosyltransferase involved in cell wall biosynthesis